MFFIFISTTLAAETAPANMAVIPAGVYRPLFAGPADAKEIPVKRFLLDVTPVSNADYLEFVRANPRWQRSNVKRIFADDSYLKQWAADLDPGSNAPAEAPVVNVSWFAAKAFAQWQGKRLPTTAEWELAAQASPTRPDGENDPAFVAEILRWYTEPASEPASVDSGGANFYGVKNLHGLVWEWVADFNSAMLNGDGRDTDSNRNLFCGAGAQNAKDLQNYPAFMRVGFRSSLKADYCIHNLGFRCAKDL